MYIGGSPIAFTNKFKKVVINCDQFYELDFFAKKFTLPMNVFTYHNYVSLIGFTYSPANVEVFVNESDIEFTKTLCVFRDIYYEKDDEYVSKESGEELIIYHDSEFAEKMRQHYRHPDDPRKKYGENVDNVLRYMSGMCGLAYLDGHCNMITLCPCSLF